MAHSCGPIAEALERIADELRRMEAMGEALQEALGPLLASADNFTMREAQGLDALVQHVQGLEMFVTRLRDETLEGTAPCTRAAAGSVPLQAMKMRLMGMAVAEGGREPVGEAEIW